MVVGDRLWVFSQPPGAPPTPVQSVLLNNPPPMIPAPTPRTPVDMFNATRNALLSRGQSQFLNRGPNFGTRCYPSPTRSSQFPTVTPFYHTSTVVSQNDMPGKYGGHAPSSFVAASTSDSGIRELERVFGNPEAVVSNGVNAISERNEAVHSCNNAKISEMETANLSPRSDEINCEALDEEDADELVDL